MVSEVGSLAGFFYRSEWLAQDRGSPCSWWQVTHNCGSDSVDSVKLGHDKAFPRYTSPPATTSKAAEAVPVHYGDRLQ